MKYFVDYQPMAKGAARPSDDGEIVGIEMDDKAGFILLPNVGDFVSVDNGMDGGNRANISGRVRSRLFRYIRGSDDSLTCLVNIVVEETDELVWAALVKE